MNINRWIMCNMWYPAMVFAGGFSASLRERLEKSFVEYNNRVVKKIISNGAKPRNVLLLLPHCLQNDDCQKRIIKTIKNCSGCGNCRMMDINKVVDENKIKTKVATGGRLAKRWVLQEKPDFIIAVACERELCEGIFSTYPLPIIGVPNERPNGPCINTTVNVDLLNNEIMTILNGRRACH